MTLLWINENLKGSRSSSYRLHFPCWTKEPLWWFVHLNRWYLSAGLLDQSIPAQKALTAPIEPPDLVWQRLTWTCGGQKHYFQPWKSWSFIGRMSKMRSACAVQWRAECLIEVQLNPCCNLLDSWVSPIICHENIKYWNNCDNKGCTNISQRCKANSFDLPIHIRLSWMFT